MRLLVNIRGTNGSGKSTVPLQMRAKDTTHEVVVVPGTKAKITVFHKYKWVALGTYINKTGGLDTIRTNADTEKALFWAISEYPNYDILMEGIIASTIKSTYVNLFKEVELLGIKVVVLNYITPLEVCLERVQARNGGKPVKTDQIASKWRTVYRNVSFFKENGLTSLKFDNSKVSEQDMLPTFLRNARAIKH